MRPNFLLLATLAVTPTLFGCTTYKSTADLPVVSSFDADRFMGTWHEIARLPQHFERDLTNVTATYSIEDGKIRIVNRGFRDDCEVTAMAVGHFAGPTDQGAFRISFFRPFYGDYRIIWLSPKYDLAMVTSSDRSSLWFLSRTQQLAAGQLDGLIRKAEGWGFAVDKLEYSVRDSAALPRRGNPATR